MIVHVKVTVVGLSFCWRGGRRWIQPIQLCIEAEIVCSDEVLVQSVRKKLIIKGRISIDVPKVEKAGPQTHKRLLSHWRRLREPSGSR